MAVRTTRVSEPVLGTAMASAGRKIWLRYVPGSSLKGTHSDTSAGKVPVPPGMSENHWMSSRASQKDGVARHAMEMTRMTWSCHLSR